MTDSQDNRFKESITFSIKSEYIELIKLLKATGLVPTGGQAKVAVDAGMVQVNGEIESRKRYKTRPGDVVIFDGFEITVTGSD